NRFSSSRKTFEGYHRKGSTRRGGRGAMAAARTPRSFRAMDSAILTHGAELLPGASAAYRREVQPPRFSAVGCNRPRQSLATSWLAAAPYRDAIQRFGAHPRRR